MYHGIYDFAVLLVPGVLLIPDLVDGTQRKNVTWIVSAAGFLAIGVALLPAVHNGDSTQRITCFAGSDGSP